MGTQEGTERWLQLEKWSVKTALPDLAAYVSFHELLQVGVNDVFDTAFSFDEFVEFAYFPEQTADPFTSDDSLQLVPLNEVHGRPSVILLDDFDQTHVGNGGDIDAVTHLVAFHFQPAVSFVEDLDESANSGEPFETVGEISCVKRMVSCIRPAKC